jgi:hypothetical protein
MPQFINVQQPPFRSESFLLPITARLTMILPTIALSDSALPNIALPNIVPTQFWSSFRLLTLD